MSYYIIVYDKESNKKFNIDIGSIEEFEFIY